MKPATLFAATLLFASLLLTGCQRDAGWIVLFDGSSLDGWTASENTESWILEDGAVSTAGPRSHLFYTGGVLDHTFKNFELELEVLTLPGSNSGVYFHTTFQDEGFPSTGVEAQVLNSTPETEPGRVGERKLTGSFYGIRAVWKSPVPDNEWFTYRIVVQGKTAKTYLNDILTAEWTEEADGERIGEGTFALQCHDPNSTVKYRSIRVKPLEDDLPTPGTPSDDPDFQAQVNRLAGEDIPLIDLHVHLKGGLTLEAALARARLYGFTYGFAVNAGQDMTLESEADAQAYLDTVTASPLSYMAMQAEGREWLDLFEPETVDRFDYRFTDAMTWTNDDGKRMRLWMSDEVEVGDPEDFMRQLVDRTVGILNEEPVDVWVNPTYLPEEIADRYDALWTDERMDRVIAALVANEIALEINDRRNIPSQAFICRAKEAGVMFTFGTNNAGADDLGRLEYPIAMVDSCGITALDIWMPGL